MTLILITREPGKIMCYSDSRVTNEPNGSIKTVTDHFSKLLILPYRATMGDLSDPNLKEVRGEFGFAFSGDITFATALYSMASNFFLSLHDNKSKSAPYLVDFADTLVRLANILLEDVIANAKDRLYSIILFGPCPKTKELKIIQIEIDKERQPWRCAQSEVRIQETGFKIIGSGSRAFLEHVKENPHKAVSMQYAEIIGTSEKPVAFGVIW